jgi:phosphoglycerate dehydrogenase-like enzyme
MGSILVNMGRFNDGFLPVLRKALPDEELVAWPEEQPSQDPEVLATLSVVGESEEGVATALRPTVKWVHVLGAGIDAFPLDQLGDRVLTCSKGATSVPIAEYVLAVMLAFEKRLPEEWLTGPPPAWNTPQGGPLGGLAGATLGLVGVGAIGTEVAKRALAFDMDVIGYRRSTSPMPLAGMRAGSLEEVLAEADHLVITAPSTPETHHLIGEGTLKLVKPGVHLVNIARGPLVDSDALIAALDDGRVARASLDVAEGEPLDAGHPFYSHPGVRLTPHSSNSSSRTANRTVQMFTENLARYRAGQPLEGIVDVEAGY